MSVELDLGLGLLDHQLLDADGRRCGKVDDVAIEGGPGEGARRGAARWARRLASAGRLARPSDGAARGSAPHPRAMGGGGGARVARPAEEDRGGVRARARRRPSPSVGGTHPRGEPVRTLSSLRKREIVTERGRSLGRCHDLRAELTASSLRVTALVVGRRGLLEHFGVGAQASASPDGVRDVDTVPWEAIVRIEGDRIVVRDDVDPAHR